MGLLYALGMAQLALFVACTWLLARLLGAQLRLIAFGAPAILRVRRANPEIRIGPIPAASIDLIGVDDGAYRKLARWRRVLLAAGPWLPVIAIAMACLGPEVGLRSVARGFAQVLVTLDVTPLVRAMVELARHAPLAVTVGVLAAKLAALNLLPFGGLAGGAVVRELVTAPGARVPRGLERYLVITLIAFMLWTLARFGWAIVQLAR